MAYDRKTNREAVKAYSHPGVSEYIPRSKENKARKPSLASRLKRLLRLR